MWTPAELASGGARLHGQGLIEEEGKGSGDSRVWMGASGGGRRRGGARGCSDLSGARQWLWRRWERRRAPGARGRAWAGLEEVQEASGEVERPRGGLK